MSGKKLGVIVEAHLKNSGMAKKINFLNNLDLTIMRARRNIQIIDRSANYF